MIAFRASRHAAVAAARRPVARGVVSFTNMELSKHSAVSVTAAMVPRVAMPQVCTNLAPLWEDVRALPDGPQRVLTMDLGDGRVSHVTIFENAYKLERYSDWWRSHVFLPTGKYNELWSQTAYASLWGELPSYWTTGGSMIADTRFGKWAPPMYLQVLRETLQSGEVPATLHCPKHEEGLKEKMLEAGVGYEGRVIFKASGNKDKGEYRSSDEGPLEIIILSRFDNKKEAEKGLDVMYKALETEADHYVDLPGAKTGTRKEGAVVNVQDFERRG